MSKFQKNDGRHRPVDTGRQVRRLNPRALILIVLALVVGVPAILGARALQDSRRRAGLLREARERFEDGRFDYALKFVNEYLRLRPNDPEALDFRGQLLAETARDFSHVEQATQVIEQVLRLDPDGPDRQETRRRLIRLYLEMERFVHPDVIPYQIAERVADELIERAGAEGPEPEDHRLLGRVYEGQARRVEGAAANPLLRNAIAEYRNALQRQPSDVEGAERLADLYRRLDEPEAADQVLRLLIGTENLDRLQRLANLYQSNPSPTEAAIESALIGPEPESGADSVGTTNVNAEEVIQDGPGGEKPTADAFLALYRHYHRSNNASLAAAALKFALRREPDDPEARILAAQDALSRNELRNARAHLNALSPADRETLQARFLAGSIDLQNNALENAIENWTQGLYLVGGTDANLTWWLAYVQLQLGRIKEAEPLMDQYKRLMGQEATIPVGDRDHDQKASTPEHALLLALKLQKSGRGASAIPALELVRLRVPESLRSQANFILGQCYEGTDVQDIPKALEAYQRAIQLAPGWSAPWLAKVRLLEESNPAEAARELERARRVSPNDPSLLIASVERLWQTELEKAPADRSWERIEALFDRAEASSPGHPRLLLARADFLNASGRLEEAVSLLGEAVQAELRTSVDAWAGYAAGLARQGRVAEALDALQEAARPEAAGDQAAFRILRARLLTQQGQGRQARAELVADLQRLPETQRPRIWQTLAELEIAQGNLEAAQEALGQAVALAPDDPGPRLTLLDLALANDDSNAIDAHVKALQDIGGLYGNVGLVHQRLRALRREPVEPDDPRVVEIERLIESILKQAPGLPAGYLLLGLLREHLGEIDEAVDAYEEVVERSRSRPAMTRLANLLLSRGQPEDVQRLGRLAANLGNEADQGRYLAQASALAGDRDRARRLANEVLEGNPESLQAHLWAARFLNSLNAPEEADRALRDLVRRRPTEPGPRLALMAFQVERGRQDEALETIDAIAENVESDRQEFLLAQCFGLVGQSERAAELFGLALKQWPDDPNVRRASAEFFEAEGRLEEAEAAVRTGLARNNKEEESGPSDPWAVRKLALMLSARPGDTEARAEARRLIEPDGPLGQAPEDRLIRAVVLARSPEPADRNEAIDHLEALTDDLPAASPTAVSGRKVLIELLLNDGRPESLQQAAQHAEALTAETLRPDAETLALGAEVLLRAGRFDQVDRLAGRFAELAPNDPRAPRFRARALLAKGDQAGAVEVLETAAKELEPGGQGGLAIAELVRLLLNFQADERVPREVAAQAVEAAGRVAREVADNESSRSWLLAEVLASQEEMDKAIVALETAINANANANELTPALERIVVGATQANRLDDAEAIVERTIEAHPEAPDPFRLLALVRHFQGRFEEEVALYARVDELNPENHLHLNNWAWTLSEDLQRPEEALPHVDRALQLARPEDLAPILDTKGVILTRLENFEEAIQHLSASARLRPAPVTLFHLALAYQNNGQETEAKAAAQQAQRLGFNPDQLSENDRTIWSSLSLSDN
ncbi:hypothetical protein BH23PLA1_BH23PLA1_24630 [soil metagenome]